MTVPKQRAKTAPLPVPQGFFVCPTEQGFIAGRLILVNGAISGVTPFVVSGSHILRTWDRRYKAVQYCQAASEAA